MSILEIRERISHILTESTDDGSSMYYRITGFHGSSVEIDDGTPLKVAFEEFRLYADANPGRTLHFEQSEDGSTWEPVPPFKAKPQTLDEWFAGLDDAAKAKADHPMMMFKTAMNRGLDREEETWRKTLRRLGAPI